MNYFWLEKHLAQWQASINSGHKPQAVIINGAAGMGKAELMQSIVAELMCREEPNDVCGKCQNCTLFQQGHHPDVHSIEPEKNILKVKMIRELTEFFTSTPHCSDYKVAILDQAETMNVAAANALLKVLEEPPSRGILFLVTDAKHRLMPTIRSRCITLDVNLSSGEKGQLGSWLKSLTGQNAETVNSAMILSNHQPKLALKMIENNYANQLGEQLDIIHEILINKSSIPSAAKQMIDDSEESDWTYLQRYFIEQIKLNFKTSHQTLYADHPLSQMLKNSPKVTHILIKITEALHLFMLNLKSQIKTQLMLESMLIEIKNELI